MPIVASVFKGMTLNNYFGTFAAQLIFPNEPSIYMLLLALLLTPTDAAVVNDTKMPKTIRSTINVESGLNDDIISLLSLLLS